MPNVNHYRVHYGLVDDETGKELREDHAEMHTDLHHSDYTDKRTGKPNEHWWNHCTDIINGPVMLAWNLADVGRGISIRIKGCQDLGKRFAQPGSKLRGVINAAINALRQKRAG
jgi:hypothetical protein